MKFIRKGISEKEKDMIGIQARKIKWCRKCNTPQIEIGGKYICLVCDKPYPFEQSGTGTAKPIKHFQGNKGGKDAITK